MSHFHGQRLLDRYALEAQIGSGGMARVFRARDERTEKGVAVKQLDVAPEDPQLDVLRAWFKRELPALMRLDHPGVVRLLDRGESDDGVPFVVTELLDGADLGRLIEERGALP